MTKYTLRQQFWITVYGLINRLRLVTKPMTGPSYAVQRSQEDIGNINRAVEKRQRKLAKRQRGK